MFRLRLGVNLPAANKQVKVEGPLDVTGLSLHEVDNAVTHHTDLFELIRMSPPTAILRRGQSFQVTISFGARGYTPEADTIRISFGYGPTPTPMNGTRGSAMVKSDIDTTPNVWTATEIGRSKDSLTVEVRSPPGAPVGQWQVQVETRSGDQLQPIVYNHPTKIYLLFNPWCKEDDVYMKDERLLGEYILSDVGKIWVGPHGSSRGRQWIFGQFDDVVLPAVMLMLDRCGVPHANRGDPVRIVRGISKIVNSNDDQGVLLGSWDGVYEAGTAPAAWTGSVPIMEEFLKNRKEVLYGQCWVFGGVCTTAARALGIPSRVVSNLVSAHDANASLTVDRYFTINNEELEYDPHNDEDGADSIWNYHVWNDVWMARRDLPKGYGGWQAIDATPQETSGGFYQCGPASLVAIKHGAVGFNYDVPFMLSSVNADLVKWREDPTCDLGYKKVECNKYHIGKAIYTKAPFIFDPNGDKDREDITAQYKMKEGTNDERLALYNGIKESERAKKFYEVAEMDKSDIEFDMVDLETVALGENFSVTVNIVNHSSTVRDVQAVLSAGSVYYTGIAAKLVKKSGGDFKIQPNSTESLRMVVRPEEYLDKLVEYCNMKIYAIATVKDTGATWAEEDDFQIIKPNLDIQINGSTVANRPCTAVFSFKNPLKKELTNCSFQYSGPGLTKNTVIPYRPIRPLEEVRVETRFTPTRQGELKLVATFTSTHLVDITGSATLKVV